MARVRALNAQELQIYQVQYNLKDNSLAYSDSPSKCSSFRPLGSTASKRPPPSVTKCYQITLEQRFLLGDSAGIPHKICACGTWRDGRAVECGGLENSYRRPETSLQVATSLDA